MVWALEKLPYFLNHGHITVYTDHQALRDAFQDQGLAKGKRSLQLMNWRLFLSKYADRMTIVHRPGRTHGNADALSRLARETDPVPPIGTDSTPLEPASFSQSTDGKRVHFSNAFPVIAARRSSRQKGPPSQISPPSAIPAQGANTADGNTHILNAEASQLLEMEGDIQISQLHLTSAFRDCIVENLPSDCSLGKFYRTILQKFKDTKHQKDGLETMLESFQINLVIKLLFYINYTNG